MRWRSDSSSPRRGASRSARALSASGEPPLLVDVKDRLFLSRSHRLGAEFVPCNAARYNHTMIKSFRHKGIKRFFETGSRAGIQVVHAGRLRRQLEALNRASRPEDMNIPGWRCHALKGEFTGHWSIWVSGNWRLTFTFADGEAILVDYRDYH